MAESDAFALDYNYALNRSGDVFGQPMNISSVNYNQVDGTPVLKSAQRIKMEKTKPLLVQGEFRGIEYYSIYGYRNLYNPGDVITPTDPNTSTPICTVISYSPAEEATCMRTSNTGSIYNGTIALYTNVLYELQAEGQTTAPPENVIEVERPGLKHKFAIFKRDLNTSLIEEQGLIFIEDGLPATSRWVVTHIDERGNVLLLDCKKDGWV